MWRKQYRWPQCFSHFASLNTKLKPWGGRYFFFFLTRTQTSFRNHLGHKDFFSTVEVLKSPFRQKKKTKAFVHCFYHHFLFKWTIKVLICPQDQITLKLHFRGIFIFVYRFLCYFKWDHGNFWLLVI
jgi:hypothetical protein